MVPFKAFFEDIDASWGQPRVTLQLIGSAALMLQTDYRRATKDSDVLQTNSLTPIAASRLLALGGRNTPLSELHRLYIDVVPNGLPFMPHGPKYHPCDSLNASLRYLRVEVLDVVDVIVSKFGRFHANDQSDIEAMVESGHVDHERFLPRFLSALDSWTMDARSDHLEKIVQRLHRVERDLFGVPATAVELPNWA